ncbi:putative alpha/beta hydrolase [Xylogone sp. PMI_703]|nr:putative alpha/beta hydrolase [Xylogone sp. PMI_703]
MAAKTTIQVPHLGGTKVGYQLSGDKYDASKPTCILINSICTTVSLYRDQFANKELTDAMNLLAIEPLGHGATSTSADNYTYWDTAHVALQVLDALEIKKVFALGTSQGGWIVTRMALLAPERIQGLFILGSSMDYESADSQSKGCWDPVPILGPMVEGYVSTTATPDFVIEDTLCGMVSTLGFGAVSEETVGFWTQTCREVYTGDEGRKKLRMTLVNLLTRDGILLRLSDIKCPVHWLHGTDDPVYSAKTIPHEHIKLFTNAIDTKVSILEGGSHYLNATNPKEVNEAVLEMVQKYN